MHLPDRAFALRIPAHQGAVTLARDVTIRVITSPGIEVRGAVALVTVGDAEEDHAANGSAKLEASGGCYRFLFVLQDELAVLRN